MCFQIFWRGQRRGWPYYSTHLPTSLPCFSSKWKLAGKNLASIQCNALKPTLSSKRMGKAAVSVQINKKERKKKRQQLRNKWKQQKCDGEDTKTMVSYNHASSAPVKHVQLAHTFDACVFSFFLLPGVTSKKWLHCLFSWGQVWWQVL